jgi:hypothetical protein
MDNVVFDINDARCNHEDVCVCVCVFAVHTTFGV